MVEHVPAGEARARFAELTDRVRYTGEPVVVEKQGRPFVALIRAEDLDVLERALAQERADAVPVRAEDHPVLAEIWGTDDDDDIFAAQPAV